MALPTFTQFAAATSATGQQLDNDLSLLAAIATMPCVAAGANAITLSPIASPPGVPAYSDYSIYSGVAASGNTGAVTARVGSLAALNVYKDTPAGPLALVGGEIIAGNYFTLAYDAALNSGAGGFHLQTSAQAISSGQQVSVASLVIGGGATISEVLTTLASIVFTTIAAQGFQDHTITLGGAAVNDAIMLGLPAAPASGVAFNQFVLSAGLVVLRGLNVSTASINPGGAMYRLTALKTVP